MLNEERGLLRNAGGCAIVGRFLGNELAYVPLDSAGLAMRGFADEEQNEEPHWAFSFLLGAIANGFE